MRQSGTGLPTGGGTSQMIVDFQHHFVPRELAPEGSAEGKTVYDAHGVPSYSFHSLLYDLDEHVAMMDEAGIDAATLSCAEGMCGPADKCRLINDAAKKAEREIGREPCREK